MQGRIKLKMWLSTREDRGTSEEDDSCSDHDIWKLQRLNYAMLAHEVSTHEPSWTWSGDLPGPALTILHQMAIQNDLSELQCAIARFIAVVQLNRNSPMDPKFIHRTLQDLDRLWNLNQPNKLSREAEQWLADAFNNFIDKSLGQIRAHREVFPALHTPSLVRLEFLLKCLGVFGKFQAYKQVCPFSKGIRGEVVGALRKGSIQWADFFLRESQRLHSSLIFFVTTISANIQLGLDYYHPLFDT